MKRIFLSLIILSMALPYLHAQSCEDVSTATVTLTQRELTPEEEIEVCGTTFESKIAFYRVTPGCLPGIFTVAYNSGTGTYSYVRFSQGNLQYQPASLAGDSVWRFAEHQYDYIGANNQFAVPALNHATVKVNGIDTPADEFWYDLFGFGTSGAAPYDEAHPQSHPLSTSKTDAEYINVSLTGPNAHYDWGVYNKIFMGGDQPGQWRTLTQPQWAYLINTRVAPDGVSKLYCHGRIIVKNDPVVTYVNGLFIFPDDFTDIKDPDKMDDATLQTIRGTQTYETNTFTLTQWEALEKVGVVFLPAAGYRDGSVINNVNSYGRYWSSTSYSAADAYACYFSSGYMYPSRYDSKHNGFSVRLVQDFTK